MRVESMGCPNLILILTDHFRPDAVGRHTPVLQRLAADGVSFANAYCASPLCQPSRASLVTGLFPSQHGVCGNQSEPIAAAEQADTFMQHLRRAGYATAMIGKHHYLDRYGIGMDVTDDDEAVRAYGFETVCQVVDDGENVHNDDEYTRFLAAGGRLEAFRTACREGAWRCDPHPFGEEDTVDGFIGRRGVEFVRSQPIDRPFYLNLSFVGPHPPYWHPGEGEVDTAGIAPPEGSADSPATRRRRAHYRERCSRIDRCIGRLLAALGERGLMENTVLVFTSDHGDNLGDYGIWDKRFCYENSVGVPLLMSGPGIPHQERMNGPLLSRALVSHVDLYPTFLRLAGLTAPRDRRRCGRDLRAMLAGEPGMAHDAVFAELGTTVMVRTAAWKLVFDPEQGGVQFLFHLVADPRESRNLAGEPGYEHVVLALLQRLLEHRIRRSQYTHAKEEQRLQRVHVGE